MKKEKKQKKPVTKQSPLENPQRKKPFSNAIAIRRPDRVTSRLDPQPAHLSANIPILDRHKWMPLLGNKVRTTMPLLIQDADMPEVPPGARDLSIVKQEDDPNIHAALLRSLDALSADQTLHVHSDRMDEHAAPFHFDENALRSLQQFIEENGLASQTMQTHEQV